MKAITICQPYAELIARGEKRVENRSWQTHYRGRLAIHAGCSRKMLADGFRFWDDFEQQDLDGLDFGAIIAVVDLVACINYIDALRDRPQRRLIADETNAWHLIAGDSYNGHATGPWCWVLTNMRRLAEPIACTGRQRLWTPDQTINRDLTHQ